MRGISCELLMVFVHLGGVLEASGLSDSPHGLLFGAEIRNLIGNCRREDWAGVIEPRSGSFG